MRQSGDSELSRGLPAAKEYYSHGITAFLHSSLTGHSSLPLQAGVTLFIHAAIRTFTHCPHLSSTYSAIGITTAKVIPGATMKISVNRQINQRQPSSWAFLVITNAASRCSLSPPRSSLGSPPSDLRLHTGAACINRAKQTLSPHRRQAAPEGWVLLLSCSSLVSR